MNSFIGTRANSKRRSPARTEAAAPDYDSAYYETAITMLFLPWLVKEIPDGKWQTLQNKLGCLIRELLSKKGCEKKGV